MSSTHIRTNAGPETVIRQVTTAPTIVSISGTTAKSAALTVGDYYVKASTDCFIKQGATSVTAATTNFPLFSGEELVVRVDNATNNGYIAAITSGATGSLYIQKVEAC